MGGMVSQTQKMKETLGLKHLISDVVASDKV